MKAIMMTVRLWWFYLTYKGIKTIEIRKRFTKDFKGKIFEYVSKTNWKKDLMEIPEEEREFFKQFVGKVGLCFECDKVDTFRCIITGNLKDGFFKAKPYCKVIGDGTANYNCDDEFENILKNAQLTNKELAQYLGDKECPYGGWYVFNAIHITKLEIFNKPKELSEFYKLGAWKVYEEQFDSSYMKRTEQEIMKSLGQTLTRAPQSFCFIEV